MSPSPSAGAPEGAGEALFGPGSSRGHERLRRASHLLPPELRQFVRNRAAPVERVLGSPTTERLLGRFVRGTTPIAGPFVPPGERSVRGFMSANLDALHGQVFECGRPTWSVIARADGAAIERTVVWDLDPRNLDASLMVDLSEDGSLGTGQYDCEIVSGGPWSHRYTERTLENLWSALRPGGTLLLALRSATGRAEAASGSEGAGGNFAQRGLTRSGLEELLSRALPEARIRLDPPWRAGLATAPSGTPARVKARRGARPGEARRLHWVCVRADRPSREL